MNQYSTVKKLFRSSILFALFTTFLLIHNGVGYGQSFDHNAYPKLDFDFQSLELTLGLQPQNLRIDGAATYQLKANVSDADTVTLYAAHMDISAVLLNRDNADYMLHNDSLFVPLPEPSEAGQQYELSIRYSGNPKFGLLKNSHETAWTSQLPNSQRHWVPIVDNPNVELKTTLNISVPSGYQVMATGKKTKEEAASVGVMRYQFTSEKEVPASGLSLAVGKFKNESTSFGVKKINLSIEKALADSLDSRQLLQKAYDYVGMVEDTLKLEYPYSRLNITVMEDHSGETKSWGASTIYLYQNRGSLETQLLRGIIAQWFGVYQRENQWEQGDAITLYQAMVHRQLSDSLGSMKSYAMPDMPASIYDRFGVNTWNGWLAGWEKWEDKAIRTIISDSRNSILKELPAVISWEDYAKYWYRQSGQPLFNIPTVNFGTEDTTASTTVPSDSVAYNVFYTLNEAEGQLKLTFEATHGEFKDLTTLKAYEIYPNEGDTSEVTFTGHRDSVMLQVDPMISTLRLETSDIPDLHLNEYKPAPFLIYEIQNDSTTTQRANAARKLGYHADNPDLQLAIQDFMENESDTEVRAALLHSLADITNGATGTEQIFLEALDSKYTSIRNAALMALQNYQGNPTVRDRAQKLALNADDFTFFRKATQVYSTLASADEFRNFAESVTNQDTTGHKSIFVIQQLANMGEVEEAVAKAELFTGDEYRYNIRSMALRILIQHDHTPADWLNRAKELMDTSDPRIRFLVVQGLGRNLDQQVTNYLKEYLQDEYDARVYRKIEQVLSQT